MIRDNRFSSQTPGLDGERIDTLLSETEGEEVKYNSTKVSSRNMKQQ